MIAIIPAFWYMKRVPQHPLHSLPLSAAGDQTWLKHQRLETINTEFYFFYELDQLKASLLFPWVSYSYSWFIFVNRGPAEAKTPETKDPSDESISVTDDTDKQFVDIIDEDPVSGETFTQEELETLPPDHEGPRIWLNFCVALLS